MTDANTTTTPEKPDRYNLVAAIPFFAWHLLCGLAFVVGFKWQYLLLALASYYVRMFGVTAGYHRYFSHRAFKTNRVFQFFLAFLAQTSAQKGALWWAAHHRHHHRYSDQAEDIHSPARKGFWYSHLGWILSSKWDETNENAIKDFARFPELRWLNRYHLVPALIALVAMYAIGGLPWLVWGGIIPTVALWHGTFFINSLTHIIGKRRYLTTDMSRNSFVLAIITCGEGWHNNHHFHQNTASQGWFWWEVDFSFYVLKLLSLFGIVSGLRPVPEATKYSYLKYTDEQRAALKAESHWGMFLPAPKKAPQPTLTPDGVPVVAGLAHAMVKR